MNSVLVTGGAGYIGSQVVLSLLKNGHDVVVIDDFSTGFRQALPAQTEVVEGSILDPVCLESLFRTHDIQSIVHLAAKLIVSESVSHPLEYYKTNVTGTISLLEMATRFKIKDFVFSSTASIYGNCASGTVSENVPLQPSNPYAWSKAMSEQIIISAAQAYNFNYVILRYFNVAGAAINGLNGSRGSCATHLIKSICEVICGSKEKVSIFGDDYPTRDGTGVRDYIHVEDLADIHARTLKYLNEKSKSNIFNCGYGRGFSVNEVIREFEKLTGTGIPREYTGRRAGDLAEVVADSTKLQKELNWKPGFDDLSVICQTALAWEKKRVGARNGK